MKKGVKRGSKRDPGKSNGKKWVENGAFDLSWDGLNHALTTLEKEAEKVYRGVRKNLPKSWEKKLEGLSHTDWLRFALRKRDQVAKEVKYYADGIVKTVNNADILHNKNRLVREAKKNLVGLINKVQKSNVALRAKDLAQWNGSKLLSLLNFPSKGDVAKLNARLSQLEKRVQTFGAAGRAR